MQNLLNIRNDCLQPTCTVKTTDFLSVYCILRLSLSTPVLNFPSRFLKLFKICNMLDRPGFAGFFLCFIIYNLVGLRVYIWRRNEPPRCPVLFVFEMGWAATQSVVVGGRRSEPVVTNHCCNLDSSETFVLCSTFSVFNIKFFQSLFENIRGRVHLYCQVLWFGVFYTLDMNLTQLLLLSL